jgi:hypothetical protein
MVTFYHTLKETLWYLLGPGWVLAEKVGMTARPKGSEDTFSLETAIRHKRARQPVTVSDAKSKKPTVRPFIVRYRFSSRRAPSTLDAERQHAF